MRQSSVEIDDTAAGWVARVDRALLSPDEEHALRLWLDADPRHRGAYARAMALFVHSKRVLSGVREGAPNHAAEGIYSGRRPKSGLRAGAVWLGAGAIALFMIVGSYLFFRQPSSVEYHTNLGEVRQITLADGSVITLDTLSTVRVRYTKARRSIQLIRGDALFDVAKNTERPFVVGAGNAEAMAVGTSFSVRNLQSEPIEILVRRGVVEITAKYALGSDSVRASADTRTIVRASPKTSRPILLVQPLSTSELQEDLIWRKGMIALSGTTLAQAAREFGRYNSIQIQLDPAVASMSITGLFSARDPIGFARAAATTLGLQVKVENQRVLIEPTESMRQN